MLDLPQPVPEPEPQPERGSGWGTGSGVAASVRVWLGALVVVAAWVVLELWGLGAAPFHTKGEPREGLVVWEMTHGGGWILPRRNGTELPSKPPLFHWLGALTSLARGQTDEWSIRFPSAALSLAGLLGVFAAGTALWGSTAGLIAALSLMTTFEWARAATNARVDMTLTVGLEAAFLGFLFFLRDRRGVWLVVMYLGIACGALGKGPVGILLPGAVALITLICTRDWSALRQMRLLYGAAVVAIIAGSWYALAFQLGGADFFGKQVLNENVFRFVGGTQFSGGHRHSNLAFFGMLLLGLLPWTLFLPPALNTLWRRRREVSFRGGEIYCVVWAAVVFGFYAFATSKRSVYLLALYPAVALLLGWWWKAAEDFGGAWIRLLLRFVGLAAAVLVGVVTAVVALEIVGVPLFEGIAAWLSPRDRGNVVAAAAAIVADPVIATTALAVAVGALLAFSVACARRHGLATFASLFVAASALIVLIRIVILPGIARHETLRDFIREARIAVGPADAMFFYRTFDYGAVFYSDGHLPTYDGPFPAGAPRFLLLSRSEWERLRARAVNDYERVRLASEEHDGPRRLVLVRRIE